MKKGGARATLRAVVSGLFFFYVLGGAAVRAACEIPFRLVGGHFVVVPVSLDGEGPFEFLLDTGTDTTLVTPDVAARLGLRPTSSVHLTTAAGSRAVPRAEVRAFSVGTKGAGGGEVLIHDLGELRALDRRLRGVAGQNFLGRFNYVLDYRRRLLLVEENSDAPPAGARLSVGQEEGKLLVAVAAGSRGPAALRLLLDSAAGGLILFGAPPPGLGFNIELSPGRVLKASTNAGSLVARSGLLTHMAVGGETFSDVPVALLAAPADAGLRHEGGLLPTSLFRSVYFNNAEGYVILNPRLP